MNISVTCVTLVCTRTECDTYGKIVFLLFRKKAKIIVTKTYVDIWTLLFYAVRVEFIAWMKYVGNNLFCLTLNLEPVRATYIRVSPMSVNKKFKIPKRSKGAWNNYNEMYNHKRCVRKITKACISVWVLIFVQADGKFKPGIFLDGPLIVLMRSLVEWYERL